MAERGAESRIDTTSRSGKLTFHIFAALVGFERQLIQEADAGGPARRERPRTRGRAPRALAASKRQRAVQLYQGKQLTVKEIHDIMGISEPSLYAYERQAQSSS